MSYNITAMSELAIRVQGLGKLYRIGQPVGYGTLRESLTNAVSALFRRTRQTIGLKPETRNAAEEYIWALKDVSFEVRPGEVIGIIGRNGAGKSTLLKILSRITTPTEGYAEINGRVRSLLEVGTGFHPELTGRENTYLSGAVLGMKRAEIDRKFDEIVDFAEVHKFIDTPLKRYSSGMQVRLAFSVAAHLQPEILLIDEVLAVGDIEFQKKCMGKMQDVSTVGRTVLFVSHNMGTIATLCPKTILLTEGHVGFIGETQQAISTYLAHLSSDAGLEREWSFEESLRGDFVRIKRVVITDGQGVAKPYFSCTEPVFVTVEYWVLQDGIPVNVGYSLYDERGNLLFGSGNFKKTRTTPVNRAGLYRSRCTIPGNLLNSGKHTLSVGAATNLSDDQVVIPHCVAFETVDDHRIHSRYSRWGGLIKPDLEWQTDEIAVAGEHV